MYKSLKNTKLPEEEIACDIPLKFPDGEITIACTNLIETLNLSRRERIIGMKINLFSVLIKLVTLKRIRKRVCVFPLFTQRKHLTTDNFMDSLVSSLGNLRNDHYCQISRLGLL